MAPKRKRKYPTKRKTTTKAGKREYQRQLMADRRVNQKIQMAGMRKAIQRIHKEYPVVYKDVFGNTNDPFGIFQKQKRRKRKRKT